MSQVTEGANTVNMASLYVGDLHEDVTEQTLWNVFNNYGHVVSVRLCRDAQTQKSLNYAYINYRSNDHAGEALKSVNFAKIDGLPCRVMWSMRDSHRRKLGIGNLFIKNIHPDVDSKILYDAFTNFGPILSCKVAVNEFGVSRGYGFIQFYNEKDADNARVKADGLTFKGRKLVVNNFVPKNQRTNAKSVNPDDFTNIFVRNYPKEWDEDDINNFFQKYGEITSVYLGRNEQQEPIGFSFVNFASPASAKKAVDELHDKEVTPGRKLLVSRAQKKAERTAYLKRQFDLKKKEYYKMTQHRNLYVKNLEENLTNEKFESMFTPFGKITSSQLVRDENGKPKGFGFVCYETVEQANAAIENMNGKVHEGKPLFVGLAQNKEERKKFMDQRAYSTSYRPAMFNAPGGMHFMYPGAAPAVPSVPYAGPAYPRYPSVAPLRGQQRMTQPITPGMVPPQGYQQQNVRANVGYVQGYNNQQHNRPRGNASYGNYRYQGSYQNRPHQQNYQSSQQHVVNVSTVASDNHRPPRPHTEKSHPVKTAPPMDSKVTIFKNRIFKLAEKVAADKGFPTNIVPTIAGVVIEYYGSNSNFDKGDSELEYAIISAFQSYNPANSDETQI